MIYEDSREAVWERLAGVLAQVRRALDAGLEVSRSVHDGQGWRPEADRHLPSHLVRREVLEHLRGLNPTLEDTDGLGLPMSGIWIEPTPHDVLRIWRSPGDLPPPRSDSYRHFYQQGRTDQATLPGILPDGGGDDEQAPPPPNNLAVLWWDGGGVLSSLLLVRPCGVSANKGVVEWSIDVLSNLDRMPDLGYGPRRRGQDRTQGEETG